MMISVDSRTVFLDSVHRLGSDDDVSGREYVFEKHYLVVYNAVYTVIFLATCFDTGFLLGLFLDPEDRGDIFLRNVH
jgi:hypothetical protein